jgi:hypothetical protein
MLTCALKAHVKIYKNRNIKFNNIKNLMIRKLNKPQVQWITSIFIMLTYALRAHVNILLK